MTLTIPQTIVEPFCAQGILGTDYIIPPQSSVDTAIMTQDDGYPISQATPLADGGVPVERNQTNGAFNLYSQSLVWLQAGGTWTFNQEISDANEGYPINTILSYNRADGSSGFVYSNIANNADNFATTPSFIGQTWIDLSQAEFPDLTDTGGLVSVTGANGLNINNSTTPANNLNISVSAGGDANLNVNGASPNFNFGSNTNLQVLKTLTVLNNTTQSNFLQISVGADGIPYFYINGVGDTYKMDYRPTILSPGIGLNNGAAVMLQADIYMGKMDIEFTGGNSTFSPTIPSGYNSIIAVMAQFFAAPTSTIFSTALNGDNSITILSNIAPDATYPINLFLRFSV